MSGWVIRVVLVGVSNISGIVVQIGVRGCSAEEKEDMRKRHDIKYSSQVQLLQFSTFMRTPLAAVQRMEVHSRKEDGHMCPRAAIAPPLSSARFLTRNTSLRITPLLGSCRRNDNSFGSFPGKWLCLSL